MFVLATIFTALSIRTLPLEEGPLKETLYRLSGEFLSVEGAIVEEHSAPEDIAESGGESTIFFIYDRDNHPIAVIKKYLADDSHFEAEYTALGILNTMSFREFHPVPFLGTSEEMVDGVPTGFIIEGVAPGKSLNHYLQEISKAHFRKRSKLLSELNRGMEKAATGLAELHRKKSFNHPSRYYETLYEKADLPGPFGYIHGDTHLGNIFYDTNTDATYFIDFSSTNVSKGGGPVGQDVANLLLAVELLSSYYGLSPAEIQTLQNSFLNTYRTSGLPISNEALSFYRNYYLTLYTTQFNEDDTDQAKYIYNYCKEAL